jgi:mRNA-degrading endonuclease RelE of RelBE toxin-antitoxin system
MLKLRLSKQASRSLNELPAKHARQIAEKISKLSEDELGVPSIELRGFAPWRRMKSGEYHIVYRIAEGELVIGLIGKRNDDEIYRLVAQFLR